VAGRPPRVPAAELAGSYAHPGYGELTLHLHDAGLAVAYHGMVDLLSVAHVDRDRWEIRALDGMVQIPLVPLIGTEGGVRGLSVGFEPLVAPLCFSRVDTI
jgi:hypothetical protein